MLGDFVFKWEEIKQYQIRSYSGKCQHEIKASSDARVFPANLWEALREVALDISSGRSETIFSFAEIRDQELQSKLEREGKAEGDGWSVQYDGLWLVIKVCKMVEIDSSGKDIYVFEKSLLSSTDRMFMLSSHIPTYDLRMNLKLDRGLENWIFHDPTVTAREYHKEAMEHVEIRKPEANKVTVHIPRWALPGIVSVIEWSEKRADD